MNADAHTYDNNQLKDVLFFGLSGEIELFLESIPIHASFENQGYCCILTHLCAFAIYAFPVSVRGKKQRSPLNVR